MHILRKLHPFASSPSDEAYYDKFVMSFVSQDMFELFDNINIESEYNISFKDELAISSIKDYKEKVPIILARLTQNYIPATHRKKNNGERMRCKKEKIYSRGIIIKELPDLFVLCTVC